MAQLNKAQKVKKNIRLVEGDHNIDCKVDGFGPMKLKSEFVKKKIKFHLNDETVRV